ncbi:MAG TPA: response regulator [Planctomycetota bacterium]|nr:response regulator [Planctomycetota bacterium]
MLTPLSENRNPPTILVVDDDEINREIVSAPLLPEGYRVLQAENGEQALRIVNEQRVDLVLMDVVMPGMDGFEVCRRIKEDARKLTLPVVFITALHDRNSRVSGKAVGGDDFLTKPVDPIELTARVRNLLRMKAYYDLKERQAELLEEELERTREQLLRADRMATLGTLAGGVGHELNNILSVLNMTLQMIRQRTTQNQPARDKDLDRLQTVADHVAVHAKQLLNFGRPGPQFAEKLDLRAVVQETLDMLRIAGRLKTVEIETILPDSPLPVEVNKTRIEQVIVNLVGNAADAVAENKERPRKVIVCLSESAAGRAYCAIEDNGCGIPPDKLEAVFAPYYTTKAPGKGTGLGLPVVKSIVESYGGKISVQSTPDLGTTFGFDLPLQK